MEIPTMGVLLVLFVHVNHLHDCIWHALKNDPTQKKRNQTIQLEKSQGRHDQKKTCIYNMKFHADHVRRRFFLPAFFLLKKNGFFFGVETPPWRWTSRSWCDNSRSKSPHLRPWLFRKVGTAEARSEPSEGGAPLLGGSSQDLEVLSKSWLAELFPFKNL